MRTSLRVLTAAAVLAAGLFTLGCRTPAPEPAAPAASGGPALDDIRAQDMAAHLRFLSDDLLEGRAPSTRGGQLAARYLATQLEQLGYEPAGENGTYFQNVAIVETLVDPSFRLTAGPGAPFTYLTDVVANSGVQQPRVAFSGDIVFVGHGIVAPEYNWNDYAGTDVKGKVVLVMVNDPPATAEEPQLFGGPALTYYGRWTYKLEEAARQGAVGAMLIHTDESATYGWQVVQTSWSGTQYDIPSVPAIPELSIESWVSEAAAREIAKRAGQDLDALRDAARKRGFKAVPFGIQASGTINQRVNQRTTPNVIGVLKGTNPNEGVIYTGHYDHLGMRDAAPGDAADADRIFNGAIDNASGLSGILEIAQAIAHAGTQPARSIYILFTTAEESGLLGAEYFAAHPVLPANAWAANINIDSLNMAGPAKDIVLLGAERSTIGQAASELATEVGRVVGPDPAPGNGYFFRSDHFPLAKIGIPAISLSEPVEYTGDAAASKAIKQDYEDKRYHQVEDEILPNWNYQGAVDDMKFLATLGWRLANAPQVPAYNANEQFARPRAGN